MEYKTYNIQLQMSDEAYKHWMCLLKQTKEAFNFCAQLVTEKNTPLGIKPFHDECYSTVRERFEEVPAQGVIKVYKEVLSALRSIKRNKHENARVPQRKQLSLHLDKRLYSKLSTDGIYLANGCTAKREQCTFVLYDKVRELFATCTAKDPTIFARDGRLFLSVPFEVATPPTLGEQAVGVDLGMKRLFVTSEGNAFIDKKYLKKRRKMRYLKRCLQSKGTKSAKRHLAKLSLKEYHLSKDMQHRASNALVESTNASVIVLEDLKRLKQSTSKTSNGFNRTRHNNAISQVPFASFRDYLTHKAQLVGKRVETVSPVYTSQTDSRTNKRDGIRKGCRYYCSDGVVFDADWNAAVNIAIRSNHPTSNALPIDGKLMFLVGKAQSAASSSATVTSCGQAHCL